MKMNMNKNSIEKMIYVPPTVEITRIVLEGGIAVQSPVRTVNVEKWDLSDSPDQPENNADIILPF